MIKTLRNDIPAAELRRLTPLFSGEAKKTKKSSIYEMLRFEKLSVLFLKIDSEQVKCLCLTSQKIEEIKRLSSLLKYLVW